MLNKNIFDTAISVSKSRELYKIDDESNCFYYVLSGFVDLYEDFDKSRIFLEKKAIFSIVGLDDFILNRKRTHTANASDNSSFLRVDSLNFEDFSSQLPNAVLKILTELSCDIKELNTLLLLNQNDGYREVDQGEIKFVRDDENDSNIYIVSTRNYCALLPKTQKEFLYDIERDCPICQTRFRSNNLRISHLKYLSYLSEI